MISETTLDTRLENHPLRVGGDETQARRVAGANVLVVDDERLVRWTLKEYLVAAGYRVDVAVNGASALELCTRDTDLVLLDYRLPDTSGLAILPKLKAIDPEIIVILMTAHSTVDNAVEAMKLGAHDYLNKPFDDRTVLTTVERALETTRLRRELRQIRAEQAATYAMENIVGESPAMQSVKMLLRKVAESPGSTVLLTGESGTGKDLAAKAIHFNSRRVANRFMNITCSALPETLLESELFGHERGAFTDAKQQKKGLLELADGGTVFLDEIGEMTPLLQAKLLRFLEERAFKRIGGQADISVDVRIVAATNRNLREEVNKGRFREDLYYRLNVLPITLPPLRERTDDIGRLVSYFVHRFNREFHKNVCGVSASALRVLTAYGWPGNIRELRNVVERAVLLAGNNATLEPSDFASLVDQVSTTEVFRLPPEGISIDEVERCLVEQALQRTNWNQTGAAKLLGLHRDQIRYRIKKFALRE